MQRILSRMGVCFSIFLSALLLSACGGGGGGGGGGVAVPVASTSSFSMVTIFANQINNGYTKNFAVTGTEVIGGVTYNVTGSGSMTVSPAVNTVFEGQAALQNTSTVNGNVTVNGVSAPIADTSQSYSSSSYVPLGQSNGEYWVVQGIATIPSTVSVGDTAVIGTYSRYTDSSKAAVLGIAQVSYVVEPDTATTAIVNLTLQEYDGANVLELTDQTRWRIDTLGNVTWISETATGSDFNYVFN